MESSQPLENQLSPWRAQMMLMPGHALLNAGSYSPLPVPVFERTVELRRQLAENPNRFIWRIMPDLLDEARAQLSTELFCNNGMLLLVPNTTYAINMVLRSLITKPMKIVTTNLEYGALALALSRCATAAGATVQTVVVSAGPGSTREVLAAFENQITDPFDLLYLSHVTSPTGMVFPIAELAAWAKKRGARVVVDGAHAPGLINVDLDHLGTLGVDFYAGNVHKWMMGPTGSAFLFQADKTRDELRPLITSWGAFYDPARGNEPSGWGGSFRELALEYQGTQDRVAQMTVPAALAFRRQLPQAIVNEHIASLAAYCIQTLAQQGLNPLIPLANDPGNGLPLRKTMTAFPFTRLKRDKAMAWLGREHRIEVAFTGFDNGDTFLRVSTGWFNTKEDVDRLAKALPLLPLDALRLS